MRAYLLFIAITLVPIALSYGVDPAGVLPRVLGIKVEGADQTQIFRALMCLLLGASTFLALPLSSPTGSTSRRSGRSFFASHSPLGG
jgi:hypothetical protein